jgi:hypothetical protein
MKRPIGVTVIAIANLLAALAFASQMFLAAQPPQGNSLIVLGVAVLLSIGLSLGLFRLHNWARWTSVVLYVLSLIRIPVRVLTASGLWNITSVLLPGIFVAWAVWYLFRPHVEAAFGET